MRAIAIAPLNRVSGSCETYLSRNENPWEIHGDRKNARNRQIFSVYRGKYGGMGRLPSRVTYSASLEDTQLPNYVNPTMVARDCLRLPGVTSTLTPTQT